MLLAWLKEEVNLLSITSAPGTTPSKIPLNLPVAYLACLIRVFYEEGCFRGVTLTEIFKDMAATFSTVRQPTVSAGSLSKEYYSVNQITAARVKELLQKMVVRLNQQFFP